MQHMQAFTLVELIVTLALAAIVLTVGVPSFANFISDSRLTSEANEFAAAINLARSEAIKRQRDVFITSTGGTDWTQGWTVWADQDQDAVQDADEILRVGDAFRATLTFTSTAATAFGFSSSGASDASDDLLLCDDRSGETGRIIRINATGRVSVQRAVCADAEGV